MSDTSLDNKSTKPTSSATAGNTQNAQPDPRPAATDKHYYWFLVVYLVLLSALGSFVNDMYSPSLPAMARFFHVSASTSQLGLTMGMIGLGLGQLLLGPISDHYGRKPVLIASLAVFIVGAVVSVFSPSMTFFLCCRFVQGLGASGGYFLARTIPADIYQGRQLAQFMALVGAVNGLAPASAPVLGGIVADAFSWKGVFVVLAIFAAIVLAIAPKLKESLYPQDRTKAPWYKTLPGYITLMRNKPFMIHVSLKAFALGLLFAYISSAPFILEEQYGFSQTRYGIIIGLNAIAVASGSMLALKFHPFKKAVPVAALILLPAVGFGAYALWRIHSFVIFEICAVVMLFAQGMIFSVSNTLAMNEGRKQAGEASALLGVAGYVVGAVVAPLAGIGNVLHSTAIVFLCLLVGILLFSWFTYRLAPDLEPTSKADSSTGSKSN